MVEKLRYVDSQRRKYIFGISLIAILCLAFPVAQGLAESTGNSDNQTPFPKALGELRSIQVSAAMGSLSDRVPVEAAPGRRNVQPHLSINYNSMAGQGLLGLGWSLEIGKIERWRGDGTPTVGEPDSYSFSLAGLGGELRNAGEGIYRPRLETIYREFRRLDEGWVMLDGEGARHYFGSQEQTRIDGRVWMLDRVEDSKGNTITFSWQKVDGAFLPVEIRYTGFAPDNDPGNNRIVFEYEGRPDVRSFYNYLSYEMSNRRLSRISIFASSNLVRRYEFSYVQSPLNGETLLSKITLVGADDASRIVLRSLNYGSRPLGWNTAVSNPSLPLDLADSEGREKGAKILDVDGDGFADAVDNGRNVYLGDGKGNFIRSSTWSNSLTAAGVAFVNGDGADQGVRLIDVNSDALPDIFIARISRRQVYLNNGSGWTFSQSWTDSLNTLTDQALAFTDPMFTQQTSYCTPPPCDGPYGYFNGCSPPLCKDDGNDPDDCLPPFCTQGQTQNCTPAYCGPIQGFTQFTLEPFALVENDGDSKGVQLVDVNADGRTDILWSMSRKERLFWALGRTPVHVRGVFLNTGNGWTRNDILTSALTSFQGEFVTNSSLQGYDVLDVNGDGLGDILRTLGGQVREVYLGTGTDWIKDDSYTASLQASDIYSLNGDKRGQGLMPVDFNDDGLVDYLRSNGSVYRAYRNTGTGWAEIPSFSGILQVWGIQFNTSDGKSSGFVLADIDGDGISDIIHAKNGSRWMLLSSRMRSGLLAISKNPLGEVSQIQWILSTSLDNRDAYGIQRLPGPMAVVGSLTRTNRSDTWTTAYDYGGGLFEEGQFRGFARSTETLPSGFTFLREYHQGEGLVGQYKMERGIDGDGRLRIRRTAQFQVVAATSSIKQFRRIQTDEEAFDYDPDGSSHTRVINTYDNHLNIINIWRDPSVGNDGDETDTAFSWAGNESMGIWSMPARIRTRDRNGVTLSESVTFYDGLSEGMVLQGLPTTAKDLVQSGSYVAKTMVYDEYGNIVQITDRAGGTALFKYDATGTFRIQAEDAEGRTVETRYDERFGEVTRDTDAGGNATAKIYDVFGRLTRITLPGDEASPYGTRSWQYSALGDPDSQHFLLRETETPGEADTMDTLSYFDGMGLAYRVERDGAAGKKVITLTEFDDAGNPVKTSRPFFQGETPLFSLIERDQMHRPVYVLEPDNVPLLMNYAGLRVDVLDRRDAVTSFLKNVDGQVTAVQQQVNGNARLTSYRYDPLGRLVSVMDPIGVETRLTYDALGRRTKLEDVNAGTYSYKYDGEGRLVKQIAPDGSITVFQYNLAGDLIRKVFPDGAAQRFTYGGSGEPNAAGRVVHIEDAAGTQDLEYDVRGNVVERRLTVQGRTFVTGYSFDSMSRLRRTTYPDGFTVHYEYDSGGNLARITDGNGRLIAEDVSYTAAGQLKEASFGNGVYSSFGYDELLRMTSIYTRTEKGDTLQQLEYAYDPDGNVLSIIDHAFGASQEFEYDEVGRLTRALGAYGEEAYQYDAAGNLIRKGSLLMGMDPDHPHRAICGMDAGIAKGNAKGIANNPRYQTCMAALQSIAQRTLPQIEGASKGNPNLNAFELVYDSRGNVVRKGDLRFEYDYENHLVRVFDGTGRKIEENIYDSAGQRVVQWTPSDTTFYIDGIYEENSTHASRHIISGSQVISTVITPRAAVRLIASAPDPMLSYSGPIWRSWGHILAVGNGFAFPLSLAGLFLLGLGGVFFCRNPRWRKEWVAAGKSILANPARAVIIILMIPVLIAVSADWTRASVRVSTPQGNGNSQSEDRYYYHGNHLGSVNVVTNDRGQVTARRDYKPYGDLYSPEGANGGPRELLMTFNGQNYEENTGLYYFGARHYDPETGRFMSADTQVPDPMNPKALNRYAFAAGNPVRYVDPSGHAWYDFLIAAFIIIVAIVITVATFGALAGVGVALIAIGAGMIAAAVALSQGLNPLSEQFWRAVVTGMMLGAVIGAGLFALPTMLSSSALWIETISSMALVGAAMGAIETTIAHFASGGSADSLLGELFVGIGMGFAIGAISGGLMGGLSQLGNMGRIAFKLIKPIKTVLRAAGVFFKALSLTYAGIASAMARKPQYLSQDLLKLMFPNMNGLGSYFSSPQKDIGVPSWIFSSTWPGVFGSSQGNGVLLQTMPMAP